MINKTKEQAMEDMKRYNADEFHRYVAEAGYESWMEEYTGIFEDSDEITEYEGKMIDEAQREMWEDVHNVKLN